ncbi:MAG TPA: radical SAM protein [Candidatus Omnitrophota bacterium]|nr:radical SAM protein [Candidatus Omnitrophota bacterium]
MAMRLTLFHANGSRFINSGISRDGSLVTASLKRKKFHVILVKPSKYDDDGYVIRWWRGIVTSNSLACLHALTQSAFADNAFLPDVEPVLHVFDETVQKIPVKKLSQHIRKNGDRAIVCMVGVQTNQFARAVDLAMMFKKESLPVMIGGFHVSGILQMIPGKTPEIQEAIDLGITLVAGEVEARWPELLRAAYDGKLESVYNFISEKPDLQGAPGPTLPEEMVPRFFNFQTSFDAGRGCPFQCSFCTIINVQGHDMRGRTAEDIEKLVRYVHDRGHKHIFITDDNFARHKDWEKITDRLIELKEKENIRCSIMIQTDTAAHKIPRFIEKMTHAGVRRVFIGMESIDAENLKSVGKYQNQLAEYRKMLQAWRDHGAITAAGYIIGFPGDTYDSIMRDVEVLKKELPLDLAEFFILTPLPGSKDHQQNVLKKIPMAADTNLYDTNHTVVKHPKMTGDEIMRAYRDAWGSFYSKEHCRTLLMRRPGPRRRLLFSSLIWFCSCMTLTGIHPLLGGFLRLKGRKDRRPGYPVESFLPYYAGRWWDLISYVLKFGWLILGLWLINREDNEGYQDTAITPE